MGSRPSKGRRSSNAQTPLLSQEDPNESSVSDNSCMVVALFDYPSEGPVDCKIRVGERLNVLSEENGWFMVRSSMGKESYIPCNYTAKVFQGWRYNGISREKAEELLLLPNNQAGSFMIRESQTYSGAHSLSVRRSTSSSLGSVKHYRIRQLENGWFYISPRLTFSSLTHLVDHYSETADGLCCLLREPCFIHSSNSVPVMTPPPPIAIRKPTFNWKDAHSSMIFGKDTDGTEESLVSEGLREAINSYLLMTEEMNCEDFQQEEKT